VTVDAERDGRTQWRIGGKEDEMDRMKRREGEEKRDKDEAM
jgi:hypothetical protein